MKGLFFVFAALALLLGACAKNELPAVGMGAITIAVAAPGNEPAYIYADGEFTGVKTPGDIVLQKGPHVVGLALQDSWVYLRKEVEIKEKTTIFFSLTDKPAASTWKALWIGLYETRGNAVGGDCSTHFSKSELDAGYDYFLWSVRQHFEKYSYGTMKWDVERKDITVPVSLTRASSSWFTAEPSTIAALMPAIQPGAYDCIFVFWREKEGGCSFQSNYLGLAWTNPMAESIKTGYVTIKFDAGDNLKDRIDYYKANDPGLWVHEWLHTVGENYFQQKGLHLPLKAGGFSVHAAEVYQYSFPWMSWYLDFVAGRVPNPSGAPRYLGIGPEALLKCSLREVALNATCN
jgi:hypothetical protein